VLECENRCGGENQIAFTPSKAALKRPQSPAMRDWRDFPTAPNCAKRLDCAAFTAAFHRTSEHYYFSTG
jgi:hypothetical protein